MPRSAGGLTGGSSGSGPSHLIPLQQAAGGTQFDPGVVCAMLPLHSSSSRPAASGVQQQFSPEAASAVFAPVRGMADSWGSKALCTVAGRCCLQAHGSTRVCCAAGLEHLAALGSALPTLLLLTSYPPLPGAGGRPLPAAGVQSRSAGLPAHHGGPAADASRLSATAQHPCRCLPLCCLAHGRQRRSQRERSSCSRGAASGSSDSDTGSGLAAQRVCL